MNIFIQFLLFFSVEKITFNLATEDTCVDNNGVEGICSFVANCPSAVNQLQHGILPKICRFEKTQTIVCCTGVSNLPATNLNTIPLVTPKTKNWYWSESTSSSKPGISVGNPGPTTNGTRSIDSRIRRIPAGAPGYISKAKCKEYSQYAYEESLYTSAKILFCPIESERLIVGGTKAARYEFPHMAQLGYNTSNGLAWLCAGSIISPKFILTASHCLKNHREYGTPKLVRVGITNQSDTYHQQIRDIVEIIKHPNYTSKYHDIGLLKLDRDLELGIYIRPACLYTENIVSDETAVATGWGQTEFHGETSENLLKVTLESFSAEKCNYTYRKAINSDDSVIREGILDDYMICYGSKTEFKDTCNGDSGGPLQIVHPDTEDIKCMYWIIGVTSFGQPCGLRESTPGVYTRVSSYVGWIESIVLPH